MPRKRRSFRIVSPDFTPDTVQSGASYAGLDYHAHCPTCGMMAAIGRFDEAPYDVQTYIHYYGAAIRQQWDEYPEGRDDALRVMAEHIDDVREYLRAELGLESEDEAEAEEESEESGDELMGGESYDEADEEEEPGESDEEEGEE